MQRPPCLLGIPCLLAAILVIAGCGSNQNASTGRSAAAATDQAKAAPPADAAPAPGTMGAPADVQPASASDPAPAKDPAIEKPMDSDMAVAEARRKSQNQVKPAVETSALRVAPAWSLTDLDGNRVESTEFAGNVVVLNFWATWCGPCKMEIPDFKRLQTAYADRGVTIIGVNMGEGPAVVKPFVDREALNYPVLFGSQKIAMDYGPITAIPVTYVLTQDGRIYKRYIGARPGAVFEADIKALIGA